MRVSGRYRSLGRHASISHAATPSSAGTSVTSVRSPSRSDAKLGRPATSSRAAARLKPSVYAEKLATPELNIRRTMGRGSQRSNGMPTGMSGAGSRPCSNTGGTHDPACSVTSGIPATRVDRSAGSVQPVTTTDTPRRPK